MNAASLGELTRMLPRCQWVWFFTQYSLYNLNTSFGFNTSLPNDPSSPSFIKNQYFHFMCCACFSLGLYMNEETKDVHFERSSGLENGILYVYRVYLLQSFFSMFHGLMDLCYYTLSFSVSFLADIDQSTM